MDQSRDNQAGKTGKSSCAKEKHHGSTCDLTGGFDTANTAYSHYNGTEYEWKDHHVQRIHINAAEKTGNCQNRCETVCQKQAGQDTKNQTGKDRTGDMLLVPCIKFFHFITSSKWYVLTKNTENVRNIEKIIACVCIWCQENRNIQRHFMQVLCTFFLWKKSGFISQKNML